jgi:nicotinamidase-related amidase
LDVRTSALLVVDLQNDTVGGQGAFVGDGAAEFAPCHCVLEQARRLVDAVRVEASRKVTHSGTRAVARDEVVLATDATATISDEWQQAALSYALTSVAELRTVDELVAELSP